MDGKEIGSYRKVGCGRSRMDSKLQVESIREEVLRKRLFDWKDIITLERRKVVYIMKHKRKKESSVYNVRKKESSVIMKESVYNQT